LSSDAMCGLKSSRAFSPAYKYWGNKLRLSHGIGAGIVPRHFFSKKTLRAVLAAVLEAAVLAKCYRP
jgi:hypothetical protein